jgi:hypothetical protein
MLYSLSIDAQFQSSTWSYSHLSDFDGQIFTRFVKRICYGFIDVIDLHIVLSLVIYRVCLDYSACNWGIPTKKNNRNVSLQLKTFKFLIMFYFLYRFLSR